MCLQVRIQTLARNILYEREGDMCFSFRLRTKNYKSDLVYTTHDLLITYEYDIYLIRPNDTKQ